MANTGSASPTPVSVSHEAPQTAKEVVVGTTAKPTSLKNTTDINERLDALVEYFVNVPNNPQLMLAQRLYVDYHSAKITPLQIGLHAAVRSFDGDITALIRDMAQVLRKQGYGQLQPAAMQYLLQFQQGQVQDVFDPVTFYGRYELLEPSFMRGEKLVYAFDADPSLPTIHWKDAVHRVQVVLGADDLWHTLWTDAVGASYDVVFYFPGADAKDRRAHFRGVKKVSEAVDPEAFEGVCVAEADSPMAADIDWISILLSAFLVNFIGWILSKFCDACLNTCVKRCAAWRAGKKKKNAGKKKKTGKQKKPVKKKKKTTVVPDPGPPQPGLADVPVLQQQPQIAAQQQQPVFNAQYLPLLFYAVGLQNVIQIQNVFRDIERRIDDELALHIATRLTQLQTRLAALTQDVTLLQDAAWVLETANTQIELLDIVNQIRMVLMEPDMATSEHPGTPLKKRDPRDPNDPDNHPDQGHDHFALDVYSPQGASTSNGISDQRNHNNAQTTKAVRTMRTYLTLREASATDLIQAFIARTVTDKAGTVVPAACDQDAGMIKQVAKAVEALVQDGTIKESYSPHVYGQVVSLVRDGLARRIQPDIVTAAVAEMRATPLRYLYTEAELGQKAVEWVLAVMEQTLSGLAALQPVREGMPHPLLPLIVTSIMQYALAHPSMLPKLPPQNLESPEERTKRMNTQRAEREEQVRQVRQRELMEDKRLQTMEQEFLRTERVSLEKSKAPIVIGGFGTGQPQQVMPGPQWVGPPLGPKRTAPDKLTPGRNDSTCASFLD
ncbi:hypothetical protein GGI42DRAFT_355072 [Trichoderma sp. SZMC 28013]